MCHGPCSLAVIFDPLERTEMGGILWHSGRIFRQDVSLSPESLYSIPDGDEYHLASSDRPYRRPYV